jgi:carotenoid cleavage dioxygenase-like enzyme
MQVAFDPRTLRSAGVYDYAGGAHVTTAHPQIDPDSSAAFNIAIGFSAVSEYRVLQLLGGGRTRRIARKAVARPPYLHSFGMSGRYIVIFEYPYTVDTLTLLLSGRPFIENFRWQPERGTRILVFERATGELAWQCETDACFAFHHVNARDDGDEIVLDLVAYPDADIVSAFYIERLRQPGARLPQGELRRYRLSRARRMATHEPLSDAGIELSHFESARLNTRPYHWLYGMGMQQDAPECMYNRLVKLDLSGGAVCEWHAPGCYPGEPVFVREPGRTAEDSGAVLSLVLDAQARNSFLLVLDAASFRERARAVLPHAVLLGYHGLFVPAGAQS